MDHIRYTTRFLNDLTVGILGMGDIGKEGEYVMRERFSASNLINLHLDDITYTMFHLKT